MAETEPIVAAWQVSGETFTEMSDEAWTDARVFMDGFSEEMYGVQITNCQPRRKLDSRGNEVGLHIQDGKILEWEGVAVLTWSPSQSSSSEQLVAGQDY